MLIKLTWHASPPRSAADRAPLRHCVHWSPAAIAMEAFSPPLGAQHPADASASAEQLSAKRRKTGLPPRRAMPGPLAEKVQSPWEYHRKVAEHRKKQMRDARDKAAAPDTVMLRTKVMQSSSAGEAKAGRLAPFESLAEAEELLRQFEPTESSSTRDPVYQATVKHSKEEWHAKLEKKANLLRMQAVVQEKWQEAHDRKATNTRMRDRLMLLALDLSRLQSENVARRKGIDAENKRRREELARIQRDHSTVTLPVTCPDNAMGGHTLRVKSKGNRASMQDKQFDVVVPEGVMPGQRFNVQFHVPPD